MASQDFTTQSTLHIAKVLYKLRPHFLHIHCMKFLLSTSLVFAYAFQQLQSHSTAKFGAPKMPRLEGWPAPRCSQCENQECTCKVTTEVAAANATEVKTANAVVRLTVELPLEHADELAKLLACHVSFADFPWAEAIYEALRPMDSRPEVVFADVDYGVNVFLRRKKD